MCIFFNIYAAILMYIYIFYIYLYTRTYTYIYTENGKQKTSVCFLQTEKRKCRGLKGQSHETKPTKL
jgi:hypothetical protein